MAVGDDLKIACCMTSSSHTLSIDFQSVLTHDSHCRVEGMLVRLAHTQNYFDAVSLPRAIGGLIASLACDAGCASHPRACSRPAASALWRLCLCA